MESKLVDNAAGANEAVYQISAPGKALITGGYLVISPANQGIVMALDCYFHAKMRVIWKQVADGGAGSPLVIKISCPQVDWSGQWKWMADG